MKEIPDGSLYVVISEARGAGRTAMQIALGAIAGGADIIQMREKDKREAELMELGVRLRRLCEGMGVKFIVNDSPELAEKVGADGVHMGQEDVKQCPLSRARAILGQDRIIGVSTHSFREFEKANEADVDYIAFGPIFKTKTKEYFIGTGDIEKVLLASRKPVFFIGGIDLSNIESLVKMGVKNIAMIGAISESVDMEATARKFKEAITG